MGQERELSEDLTRLSEAVAKWRAERGGRGKRIPEELWSEAARVARTDGVWLTAKATRLNYWALRGLKWATYVRSAGWQRRCSLVE
jgi:hypothetical protein